MRCIFLLHKNFWLLSDFMHNSALIYTVTEMLSFWFNFHQWLQWKLSFWPNSSAVSDENLVKMTFPFQCACFEWLIMDLWYVYYLLEYLIVHVKRSECCDFITHWGQDKMSAILHKHFQTHFLEWKLLYFDSDFIKVYSHGYNSQEASIGSDNVLVSYSWQAIIGTKDDVV